jgi:hypothetical protein
MKSAGAVVTFPKFHCFPEMPVGILPESGASNLESNEQDFWEFGVNFWNFCNHRHSNIQGNWVLALLCRSLINGWFLVPPKPIAIKYMKQQKSFLNKNCTLVANWCTIRKQVDTTTLNARYAHVMTENSLLSCLCIISQCVYSAHTRH